MRKKELKLVITFPTTSAAMAMETACKGHQMAGRLIPVPSIISAGCGLAWATGVELEKELREFMEVENLIYEAIVQCLV